MMIFDFLVLTLRFHSSACFLITLIDCCNPCGEGHLDSLGNLETGFPTLFLGSGLS